MAEIWRWDRDGVPRKVREVWRYDAAGVPRKAREIWRYDWSGVARKVFSGSFVLTAVPDQTIGDGTSFTKGGVCSALTGTVNVVVEGGNGPFTYVWSAISGTPATARSPNAPSTIFQRNEAAPTKVGTAKTYSGVMRCTVTDTGSGEVKTVDVTVITKHFYDF